MTTTETARTITLPEPPDGTELIVYYSDDAAAYVNPVVIWRDDAAAQDNEHGADEGERWFDSEGDAPSTFDWHLRNAVQVRAVGDVLAQI